MAFLEQLRGMAPADGGDSTASPRAAASLPRSSSFTVTRNACQAGNKELNSIVRDIKDTLQLIASREDADRVASGLGKVPLSNSRALMVFAADASHAWLTVTVRAVCSGAARAGALEAKANALGFEAGQLRECSPETASEVSAAVDAAKSMLAEAQEVRAELEPLIKSEARKAASAGHRTGLRRKVDADGMSLDTPGTPVVVPDGESAADRTPLTAAAGGNRAIGGSGGSGPALRSPHGGADTLPTRRASASGAGFGGAKGGSETVPGWLSDLLRHVRLVLARQPGAARDPFKEHRADAARGSAAGLRARPQRLAGRAGDDAAGAAGGAGPPSGSGGDASAARSASAASGTGQAGGLRAAAMRRAAERAESARGAGRTPDVVGGGAGPRSPPELVIRAPKGGASALVGAAAAGGMPSPAVVAAPHSRAADAPVLDTADAIAVVHAAWMGVAPRPARASIVGLTRMFGGSAAMACGGLGDWLSRNRDIAEAAGLVGVKVAAGAALRAVTPPVGRA